MTAPLRILLLDTETNGLPRNRYAPISLAGNWPAVLQLSWGIYELGPDGRSLRAGEKRDIGLALAPEIPWDAGAAAVHGISEGEARRGTPPLRAFTELHRVLREVDVVVAHNLAFDKPVLRAAAYAVGLKDLWPATGTGAAASPATGTGAAASPATGAIQEFCTMEATRGILRLPLPSAPTSGRFKAPRLNELYTWLYGHVYDMSGAVLHTAASDTHCLEQCLKGLLRRGIVRVEGVRLVTSPASSSETSPSAAALTS
jgi:DNA polymerase-3 subunit alpha